MMRKSVRDSVVGAVRQVVEGRRVESYRLRRFWRLSVGLGMGFDARGLLR